MGQFFHLSTFFSWQPGISTFMLLIYVKPKSLDLYWFLICDLPYQTIRQCIYHMNQHFYCCIHAWITNVYVFWSLTRGPWRTGPLLLTYLLSFDRLVWRISVLLEWWPLLYFYIQFAFESTNVSIVMNLHSVVSEPLSYFLCPKPQV